MASRKPAESVSECAGLTLSIHIARNRSGWSVRISSAIELHGTSPEMIRAPVTGVRRSGAPRSGLPPPVTTLATGPRIRPATGPAIASGRNAGIWSATPVARDAARCSGVRGFSLPRGGRPDPPAIAANQECRNMPPGFAKLPVRIHSILLR